MSDAKQATPVGESKEERMANQAPEMHNDEQDDHRSQAQEVSTQAQQLTPNTPSPTESTPSPTNVRSRPRQLDGLIPQVCATSDSVSARPSPSARMIAKAWTTEGTGELMTSS